MEEAADPAVQELCTFIDDDDDFLLENSLRLPTILEGDARHPGDGGYTTVGTITGPRTGATYTNVTLEQYAVIFSKSKALRVLLDKRQSHIPFAAVLAPRTSNTKLDLLTLAVLEFPDPPSLAVLNVLLTYIQQLPDHEGYLHSETFTPQKTPLVVAVERRNWAAVRALIQAGADPARLQKGGTALLCGRC
jgi:hypothetical protein